MRRCCFPFATAILILLIARHANAQTNYDTSPGSQTGVQVFGSYFATDIDTISNYNRNLHLSIPVFSLPGRQLPYGLKLTYNAQKWEQDTVGGYLHGRYTGGWIKDTMFGSAPSFYVQNFFDGGGDTYLCYVYWIDGAGTKQKYATTWNKP